MSLKETPSIPYPPKDLTSRGPLKFIQDKLLALNSHAAKNDHISIYRQFLEFIIDISQHPNPNIYFDGSRIDTFPQETSSEHSLSRVNLKIINDTIIHTLKEDVLDLEDFEQLWKVMQQNLEIHSAVYEGLSQTKNNSLNVVFLEYVIMHLLEISYSEEKVTESDVISCVCGICDKPGEALDGYLDFYWQTLSQDPTPSWTSENFVNKMETLIERNRLNAVQKMQLMYNCIKSSDRRGAGIIALRVIKKILESYSKTTSTDINKDLSQRTCVRLLCEEKDLLNKVVRDMQSLVSLYQRKGRIEKQGFVELAERIQFIGFLISSYPEGVGFETMSVLWKTTETASDFKDLDKQFVSLIKGIVESEREDDIQLEGLVRFLEEKIDSSQCYNLLKTSKEGFECFRSIFVFINQYHKNISEVVIMKTKPGDFPCKFERLRIKSNDLIGLEGEFLFQVDVVPSKLKGYTTLFKLACLAEDEYVSSKARDLLNFIYTNLNTELFSYSNEIMEQYLSLCFQNLKEMLSEDTSRNKILKCLELIEDKITGKESHDLLKLPLEAYLIQHDGTLNPRAKDIFAKWFENYSDNGKMSPHKYAEFVFQCTSNQYRLTDPKVKQIFIDYDDDKDCYLTLDNFLSLYLQECKTRLDVVWKNLFAMKESSDLRPLVKKKDQSELNLSCDIIMLISSNSCYMKILLSLLDLEEEVATKTSELLKKLPAFDSLCKAK